MVELGMYAVTNVVKKDHGSRPKNKSGARKGHNLDVYVKYEWLVNSWRLVRLMHADFT